MLRGFLKVLGVTEEVCVVCGATVEDPLQGYVCGNCIARIRQDKSIHPDRRLPRVQGFRVFSRYEGVLGEVIRLVKFRRVLPLARKLGEVIAEDIREYTNRISPDLITFVPVHILRKWSRGFDQNREILKGAGMEFEETLVRVKYSRPLALFDRRERQKAVRGAFKVRRDKLKKVRGAKVLVFDDVITTGSTAVSVAEILIGAGAVSVYFYFVASED